MDTPTQGWQCPCCETVYAPHVSSCKCEKAEALKPIPYLDNDVLFKQRCYDIIR